MANYVIVNGELYHHGIKGMKWGVRRYQNKDGTLTYAGRKRAAKEAYKRADDEAFKRYEKSIASIEKNYKRGQNLSEKDAAREIEADRRYQSESAKAKAAYKQAKKEIRADKAVNKKKMDEELRTAGYANSFGYNASRHAKQAVGSGLTALGVAAVGSAATHALAKRGKQHAAEQVYSFSKRTFNSLTFSAQVSAGFSAVNYMMGGSKAVKDYRKTEKKIRSKYSR